MTLIVATLVALGLGGWGLWRAMRAYLKFRGKRLVTCPETRQPAAVQMATWHIVITAPFGRPDLRLRDCSRWRERERCAQPCLPRIEASPEDCLVSTIVSTWYEGKACSCCGTPLADIRSWQHKPCVMSPEMRLFEWKDIPAEQIPSVLETHAPVCWRCLVAETHIS